MKQVNIALTPEQAIEAKEAILDNQLGLYLIHEEGKAFAGWEWRAVDTTTGRQQTEFFQTVEGALLWLTQRREDV